MGYALLAIAIGFNAAANLLLKVGAGRIGEAMDAAFMTRLAGNIPLLSGLALFAINVTFYVAATARLNLSIAYPLMSAGSLFVVVVASMLLLRETVSGQQWLGLILIVAGMALVAARGGR